ncbi:hypothetical protein EV363DRAFT_1466883 [Boletus edulis]|nr:hypothetical protein EV363DRAFT_1466883 [Boletus edulis]
MAVARTHHFRECIIVLLTSSPSLHPAMLSFLPLALSPWAIYFPLPEIIPPNVLGDFFFTTTDGRTRLDSIPSEAHSRVPILVHQVPHSCHPPSSPKKESAGMGGAILAKYAWWKQQPGGSGTFEEMGYERMRGSGG